MQRRDLLAVLVNLRLLGVSEEQGAQLVGYRPEVTKPQLDSAFQAHLTRSGIL
jgi:hypothetical protein